jgi:hypothetical protein
MVNFRTRNRNSDILLKAHQCWQKFKPKLDVATQLDPEIFRPRLAVAQEIPLFRGVFAQR